MKSSLRLENLEERVTPTTWFAGATIMVWMTGTGTQSVHVTQEGSEIVVNESGDVKRFSASPVKSLVVLGAPWANNDIDSDIAVNSFLFGGNLSDVLDGGQARNILWPGRGSDTVYATNGINNSVWAADYTTDTIYARNLAYRSVDTIDLIIYV